MKKEGRSAVSNIFAAFAGTSGDPPTAGEIYEVSEQVVIDDILSCLDGLQKKSAKTRLRWATELLSHCKDLEAPERSRESVSRIIDGIRGDFIHVFKRSGEVPETDFRVLLNLLDAFVVLNKFCPLVTKKEHGVLVMSTLMIFREVPHKPLNQLASKITKGVSSKQSLLPAVLDHLVTHQKVKLQSYESSKHDDSICQLASAGFKAIAAVYETMVSGTHHGAGESELCRQDLLDSSLEFAYEYGKSSHPSELKLASIMLASALCQMLSSRRSTDGAGSTDGSPEATYPEKLLLLMKRLYTEESEIITCERLSFIAMLWNFATNPSAGPGSPSTEISTTFGPVVIDKCLSLVRHAIDSQKTTLFVQVAKTLKALHIDSSLMMKTNIHLNPLPKGTNVSCRTAFIIVYLIALFKQCHHDLLLTNLLSSTDHSASVPRIILPSDRHINESIRHEQYYKDLWQGIQILASSWPEWIARIQNLVSGTDSFNSNNKETYNKEAHGSGTADLHSYSYLPVIKDAVYSASVYVERFVKPLCFDYSLVLRKTSEDILRQSPGSSVTLQGVLAVLSSIAESRATNGEVAESVERSMERYLEKYLEDAANELNDDVFKIVQHLMSLQGSPSLQTKMHDRLERLPDPWTQLDWIVKLKLQSAPQAPLELLDLMATRQLKSETAEKVAVQLMNLLHNTPFVSTPLVSTSLVGDQGVGLGVGGVAKRRELNNPRVGPFVQDLASIPETKEEMQSLLKGLEKAVDDTACIDDRIERLSPLIIAYLALGGGCFPDSQFLNDWITKTLLHKLSIDAKTAFVEECVLNTAPCSCLSELAALAVPSQSVWDAIYSKCTCVRQLLVLFQTTPHCADLSGSVYPLARLFRRTMVLSNQLQTVDGDAAERELTQQQKAELFDAFKSYVTNDCAIASQSHTAPRKPLAVSEPVAASQSPTSGPTSGPASDPISDPTISGPTISGPTTSGPTTSDPTTSGPTSGSMATSKFTSEPERREFALAAFSALTEFIEIHELNKEIRMLPSRDMGFSAALLYLVDVCFTPDDQGQRDIVWAADVLAASVDTPLTSVDTPASLETFDPNILGDDSGRSKGRAVDLQTLSAAMVLVENGKLAESYDVILASLSRLRQLGGAIHDVVGVLFTFHIVPELLGLADETCSAMEAKVFFHVARAVCESIYSSPASSSWNRALELVLAWSGDVVLPRVVQAQTPSDVVPAAANDDLENAQNALKLFVQDLLEALFQISQQTSESGLGNGPDSGPEQTSESFSLGGRNRNQMDQDAERATVRESASEADGTIEADPEDHTAAGLHGLTSSKAAATDRQECMLAFLAKFPVNRLPLGDLTAAGLYAVYNQVVRRCVEQSTTEHVEGGERSSASQKRANVQSFLLLLRALYGPVVADCLLGCLLEREDAAQQGLLARLLAAHVLPSLEMDLAAPTAWLRDADSYSFCAGSPFLGTVVSKFDAFALFIQQVWCCPPSSFCPGDEVTGSALSPRFLSPRSQSPDSEPGSEQAPSSRSMQSPRSAQSSTYLDELVTDELVAVVEGRTLLDIVTLFVATVHHHAETVTVLCRVAPVVFWRETTISKSCRRYLTPIIERKGNEAYAKRLAEQVQMLQRVSDTNVVCNFVDHANAHFQIWDSEDFREACLEINITINNRTIPLSLPKISISSDVKVPVDTMKFGIIRLLKSDAASNFLLGPVIGTGSQTIVVAVARLVDEFRSKFQGTEDCVICYSRLHATTKEAPTKECEFCQNKFHKECLKQ
ncbi:hypothetical protein GNI_148180 [Gregarina niphandrodes]|uniref:E3 ubiquitin-protein ligase listerin n=1 Tax=Gregarina niphandrodes TaxID=110365 RepID=A0A023B0J1_GRENI|nr:hypothetical protein GNI_148180 [Gregarina niphandrodes]EZG44375.1 hypothetical protein GNI_148180 [Gregarina niphandrodes]|eukprot:XP_011132690.1 hypothetical protein GNI_148180 [Gregarina niphandrodes]